MISVVVVARTRLYREGLARSLGRRSGISVIGAAADPLEATAILGERAPDVVLVDVTTRGDLFSVAPLVDAAPGAKVVALAVPEEEFDVVTFAEAGFAAFVPASASISDLVGCIRGVVRGDLVCSPRVAGILLRRVHTLARTRSPQAATSVVLTSRQAQILELVAQGLSNKEIAVRLSIELSTVKNHVHQILDRLRVHRRAEAAAFLRQLAEAPAAANGGRSPAAAAVAESELLASG